MNEVATDENPTLLPTANDDDTGIGFGFEKTLDTFSISVDYITYYDKLGIDVNAFNLGLVTYF